MTVKILLVIFAVLGLIVLVGGMAYEEYRYKNKQL